VLVAIHRAIVHAILVAPGEFLGHILYSSKKQVVGVGRIPTPGDAKRFSCFASEELTAADSGTGALENSRWKALGIRLAVTAARHCCCCTPRASLISVAFAAGLVRFAISVNAKREKCKNCEFHLLSDPENTEDD
jgi:hypothetical protein